MTGALLAVIVAGFGFGDIALTAGMKRAGEAASWTPPELLRLIGRAFRSPAFLAGIALQGIALAAYLAALSRADLSLVFPLTAASTILTTLAARPILGERVGPRRWAGVAIVASGLLLISLS